MPTSYPAAFDAFSNPTSSDNLDSISVPHAAQHTNVNDAVEAIQAELGLDPAGGYTTVRARLEATEQLTGSLAAPNSALLSLFYV